MGPTAGHRWEPSRVPAPGAVFHDNSGHHQLFGSSALQRFMVKMQNEDIQVTAPGGRARESPRKHALYKLMLGTLLSSYTTSNTSEGQAPALLQQQELCCGSSPPVCGNEMKNVRPQTPGPQGHSSPWQARVALGAAATSLPLQSLIAAPCGIEQ